MSTTQHTIFTQNLSTLNTSSKEKESETIVKFLDYSTIDEVPEEIRKQLYNQGLPSNKDLSRYPIICGYLKNQNNMPFIAYLELSDSSSSVDNATLKYWTADGNYCWEPSSYDTKKLTFEHLEHFRFGEYFSKKSQTTLNGALNETVDDPFVHNSTLKQECAGDFSIVEALCKDSNMFQHNRSLTSFFVFPIKFHGIGDDNSNSLIEQSTPDFPDSYSKLVNIVTFLRSSDRPQGYLVSIALSNKESRKRISYLYESQKAYENREKPLMIYKRVPSENSSASDDKEIKYLLTNSDYYIKFDPNDIVLKPNGYKCFRVLSYEKVVEGFPTDVSEEAKKMVANPFPPELPIINAEAIKRYKESLQDKTITQKNTGIAYE